MRRDDAEDGPTLVSVGCTLAAIPVVGVVAALLVRIGEYVLGVLGRVQIDLR